MCPAVIIIGNSQYTSIYICIMYIHKKEINRIRNSKRQYIHNTKQYYLVTVVGIISSSYIYMYDHIPVIYVILSLYIIVP